MSRVSLAAFVAAMIVVSLGSAQVPPPSQGVPPATGSGFIAGRVVDAVSGKPIPEATVMLNGRSAALQAVGLAGGGRGAAPAPPPPPPAVLTDSQGRFFFASLAPGLYTTQVQKTGYAPAPFGPIELRDGERVFDWQLKLAKYSSLAGTLRDETGDPAVGVDVLLFRRGVANGRQSWQNVGRARSDDRGLFRLGNLPAGDYVVCACSRDPIPFDPLLLKTLGSEPLQLMSLAARALSVGSDAVSLDDTLRTYAPLFYQNSASLARSTKVSIAAGEDKTSLDMTLQVVRATRVSGTLTGAPGPVQAQFMKLVPEGDADAGVQLFSIPPILVQPDGRFDFATVPPGQYRLIAVYRPQFPATGPSGAAMSLAGARGISPPPPGATMASNGPVTNEPPLWASEVIAVGETGVNGLVVSLNRSPSVTGRVEWVGAAPQPPAQMLNRATVSMLTISPSDPLASMTGPATGRFSPDATFFVPGVVPGKYSINANVLPGYPTLKSVMIGGMDVTDLPIEIGEKDMSSVVLTYVDTPMASLTITVTPTLPATMSAGDSSVLVFPADRKYWTEPAAARRRFRQIAESSKSVATTPELPAGDYLVVFASALETSDWMEPGKLELLSRRAQRVIVGNTGKTAVEVRR